MKQLRGQGTQKAPVQPEQTSAEGPALESTNSSSNQTGAQSRRYVLSPGSIQYDSPLVGCFSIISGLLGRPISSAVFRSGLPQGNEPLKISSCLRAAEKNGIRAKILFRPKLTSISQLTLPCILLLQNRNACVLTTLSDEMAEIISPEAGQAPRSIATSQLAEEYTGYSIFCGLEEKLDKRAEDVKLVDTRRWFWGTILRFMPIYKHVILATVMVNLLAIAGPVFIMNVYDRVIPNNAIETLWVLALGVLIAYVFDFILRNLRGYFVDVAGKNSDVLIASRLMQQVTSMRLDHKPDSAGTLANNLREFESLREFFSSTTLLGLVDMPFIFIFIAVISYVGGPLAWAPLMAVPLVILVGVFIQPALKRVIEKGYREGSQKNALIVEAIGGLEPIKACMAEGQIQNRWEDVVGLSSTSMARSKALANFSITFSQFVAHLVSVIIVVGGVYLIAEGELTMGGLISCNILAGRAMAPLGTVAAMLTRLQQSRMALKSLDILMKIPNESPVDQFFVNQPYLKPSISMEKVQFKYPGAETTALQGLSLTIKSGEKVGIIGKTGSGKSTMGRLCMGFYLPQEGKVKLGDVDIRQMHVADLRSRIGYVSQDNYLFYGSVRENITFGTPFADDRAILRASEIAGVIDFIRSTPSGFALQVGERGMALSGGQRQAVAIARALLQDPDILIFDEPTSAMDNASEQLFRKRLAQTLKNKTLILFTHRSSMLSLVERLVVLDGGKVVADGPRNKVLQALKEEKIRTST